MLHGYYFTTNDINILQVLYCNCILHPAQRQKPLHSWPEDEDEPACRIVKLYKKVVPHSGVEVDSVTALLHTTDMERCIQACCQRGPNVCQYAWLFEGKCLAVSCHLNPAKCYPKSVSTYTSLYAKIGYYDEEDRFEPTNPGTELTDQPKEVEPTGDNNLDTEVPTQRPTPSKEHHHRPFTTKPAITPNTKDNTVFAELEDALNSTWQQATLRTVTSPPPPSTSTHESPSGSMPAVNITAANSANQETNIGVVYVFALLSCFFGFLFLFFLILGCGYYLTRSRNKQTSKKISYTVVDHDDHVNKSASGKGPRQQPSSIVLSDSETDEESAMFSALGAAAAREDARGRTHTSLATGLLPL